jgi:hypothetical protein
VSPLEPAVTLVRWRVGKCRREATIGMISDTSGADSVTNNSTIKTMSVCFLSTEQFRQQDSDLPRFSMLCERRASNVCKL